MTVKANDVLSLVRVRAIIGCSPQVELVDAVEALRRERDAAIAEANAMRELLIEEQQLRHEYGMRLARQSALVPATYSAHDTESKP